MKIRRAFWDLETSPLITLSWRIGGKIRLNPDNILQEKGIMCVCWKWEGERKVHSLEWDKGDDRKLVKEFAKVVEEADELVAHNGDRFDLPVYQGRHLFHDLPPIPESKTVDTLAIARRRFKISSNKLDYLGEYLGLGRKHHTEFQMWKDILLDNCPKAMRRMVRYCKQDVKLLEQVWSRMAPYHKPKSHAGVASHRAKWSCCHCGTEKVVWSKRKVTAAGTPQIQMQCKDCGRYSTVAETVYKDFIASKHDKKTA